MAAKDPDDVRITETSTGEYDAYDIDGVRLGGARRHAGAWRVQVGIAATVQPHRPTARRILDRYAREHLRRQGNTRRLTSTAGAAASIAAERVSLFD